LDPIDKSLKEAEDRRQARRHTFSATAEVVEVVSGARLSARAADLSLQGCYLDSLNPFAIGTNVRVRIHWGGAELTCAAVVRDSQLGMGMGLAFTNLDDTQKALIESWIKKLSSSALANLSPSSLSENTKPILLPDQRDALALRLIDLLHKKGVLSSNEVASLLRDRIL
jgi:hypothetical protein